MTLDSVVVATNHQMSAELGDETIILHLEDGLYYGLEKVGARIWQLISEEARSVQSILTVLLGQYDVDADECQRDLFALLEDLRTKGLIEIQDAQSP